jgi:hypothetical protein
MERCRSLLFEFLPIAIVDYEVFKDGNYPAIHLISVKVSFRQPSRG